MINGRLAQERMTHHSTLGLNPRLIWRQPLKTRTRVCPFQVMTEKWDLRLKRQDYCQLPLLLLQHQMLLWKMWYAITYFVVNFREVYLTYDVDEIQIFLYFIDGSPVPLWPNFLKRYIGNSKWRRFRIRIGTRWRIFWPSFKVKQFRIFLYTREKL